MSGSTGRGKHDAAGLRDSKSTTSTLDRTRAMMERNLLRLDGVTKQLNQDGEFIKDSLDVHSVELKGALLSTKKNLNKVKSAELWERYSLRGSLVFFFSVVIYIVCKRTRILTLFMFTLNKLLFDDSSAIPSRSPSDNVLKERIGFGLASTEYEKLDEECVGTSSGQCMPHLMKDNVKESTRYNFEGENYKVEVTESVEELIDNAQTVAYTDNEELAVDPDCTSNTEWSYNSAPVEETENMDLESQVVDLQLQREDDSSRTYTVDMIDGHDKRNDKNNDQKEDPQSNDNVDDTGGGATLIGSESPREASSNIHEGSELMREL